MAVLPVLLLFLLASAASAADALIQDRTHDSQVFGETRNYRIFLPPDYAGSAKRYPVIYWFHGWSERYNKPVRSQPQRNYDEGGGDYGADCISAFAGSHDVIVVKWDGYNPRTKDEDYLRPYNISPVETRRQFPLYFPELVDFIDNHYRTIADREHRATSGLSMGGFMSFWVAGKYPDMISSASNFMGSSEFVIGPMGFPVEYRHDEMAGNYDGVRTRLVTGTQDFIRFYHRQMIALWKYTRPFFETEEFEFDHGTPAISKTFDFHMQAFAAPLPRPAVWNHADVYPNFIIWGWDVVSNRRQPGITWLENVSKTGFRSSVREWLPDGGVMPLVQLTIQSPRLYARLKPYTVTMVRLRDGQTRRAQVKADVEGRLAFKLDGDAYEVGITSTPPEPVLALTGYHVESGEWATAGMPVKVNVRFTNKGTAVSKAAALRWETPNPLVQIDTPEAKLRPILPGASIEVPLAFVVKDEARKVVELYAADASLKLPLEIPLFPPAPVASDYVIADGKALTVYRNAVKKEITVTGDGNGDGRANAGERIAIAFPDGDAMRLAELFSNDRCVDNTTRISDSWGEYDHVGASVKYSLPLIKPTCPPNHVLQFMTRVLLPDKPEHKVRYAVVQFTVNAAARSAATKASPAAPARRPAARPN